MSKFYDQTQLRQSMELRNYIHTAVLNVAETVIHEDEKTEYHTERVRMAEKILRTNESMVNDFIDRIVFRAIMSDEVRETMIHNGRVALEFADDRLVADGILALWNETTLAVWPNVMMQDEIRVNFGTSGILEHNQ